ncbi:unnamed protein product [Didymodactylos carnosus]|nr:unnamed protein product [Didymodactylos carnosus]CAF4493157.1 unnamed protein product [Didymodactylos carnosus]
MIRSHILCRHLYYSGIFKRRTSKTKLLDIHNIDNMTDIDLLREHSEALSKNMKIADLKAYHLYNGDYRFHALWTTEKEGSSLLFLGLTYDELVEKLNSLLKQKIYTAIIANYGMLIDGQQVYALVCNQYGTVW